MMDNETFGIFGITIHNCILRTRGLPHKTFIKGRITTVVCYEDIIMDPINICECYGSPKNLPPGIFHASQHVPKPSELVSHSTTM